MRIFEAGSMDKLQVLKKEKVMKMKSMILICLLNKKKMNKKGQRAQYKGISKLMEMKMKMNTKTKKATEMKLLKKVIN